MSIVGFIPWLGCPEKVSRGFRGTLVRGSCKADTCTTLCSVITSIFSSYVLSSISESGNFRRLSRLNLIIYALEIQMQRSANNTSQHHFVTRY